MVDNEPSLIRKIMADARPLHDKLSDKGAAGGLTPETFVCLVDSERPVKKVRNASLLIVDRSTADGASTCEIMLQGQIESSGKLESIRTNSILVYLECDSAECGGVFITKSGSRYQIASYTSFSGDESGNMSVFDQGDRSCWVQIKKDAKEGFAVDVDLENLRFPVGQCFLDAIRVIDTLYYVVKKEDEAAHVLYCSSSGCTGNKEFSALNRRVIFKKNNHVAIG
jgi:hypothetical protein